MDFIILGNTRIPPTLVERVNLFLLHPTNVGGMNWWDVTQ